MCEWNIWYLEDDDQYRRKLLNQLQNDFENKNEWKKKGRIKSVITLYTKSPSR